MREIVPSSVIELISWSSLYIQVFPDPGPQNHQPRCDNLFLSVSVRWSEDVLTCLDVSFLFFVYKLLCRSHALFASKFHVRFNNILHNFRVARTTEHLDFDDVHHLVVSFPKWSLSCRVHELNALRREIDGTFQQLRD